MLRKVGALVVFAALATTISPAATPDLPEILVTSRNAVPACVTPGRLMAFLKMRNPELSPRYDGIATEYMRFGELLGIRWDFAFYQMIVETGSLSYWRGSRAGDVRAEQHNFAGLGATGGGERGESFKDVETGVRAHIEHIVLYAGKPVQDPVAERTRKVRDWGLLTAWQQSIKRPITFADLATKWAGNSKSYGHMLQTVAERFHSDVCGAPDPRPALVHEARRLMGKAADAALPRSPGQELAQRAMEQAKAEGIDKRSGLGAAQPPPEQAPAAPPYKVLNMPAPDTQQPGITPKAENKIGVTPKAGSGEKAGPRTALAGPAAGKAKGLADTAVPPAANQKCRVWTASYGGQKSIIIRSVDDQVVNFTVLDVNAGSETREADAFIAAYAKNGTIAGEYASQAQALDKAFELCPEG
jgi:hypothetical protein